MSDERIDLDSTVTFHFTLSLPDGTLVDRTEPGQPLTVTLGDGTLIEGLEHALLGLRPGNRRRIVIPPETGWGPRDPALIQWRPRRDFPADMDLAPGLILSFTAPDGEEIPAAILAVEDDRVQVDYNHPLAGRDVVFEVEVVAVEPG